MAQLKKLKPIEDVLEQLEEDGEELGGKIKTILALHLKGYSNKDIVAAGFNKSTVYRQVGDFKKLRKAPALEYMGYSLFEARVLAYMKAKKCTRETAVKSLMAKDIA